MIVVVPIITTTIMAPHVPRTRSRKSWNTWIPWSHSESKASADSHLFLHLTFEFFLLQFLVLWFCKTYLNTLTLQVQPIETLHCFSCIFPLLEMNERVVFEFFGFFDFAIGR